MGTQYLTTNQKKDWTPLMIRRDGHICFYCVMPFVPEVEEWQQEFDHLNNDETDNRIENVVFAHRECNNLKKQNYDWQIKAMEKLRDNMSIGLMSEGERSKIRHKHTDEDEELSEGEVNKIINETVKNYLNDKFHNKNLGEMVFKTVLDSITFLIKMKTGGRGSQPAVRRTLDAYCSDVGPYRITKREGKRYIQRRETETVR